MMSEGTNRVPPKLAVSRLPAGGGLMIAAAVLLISCAALFLFNPAEHGFYPRCLFHVWTGLQCPGCGGLRAMHQLLHGNLPAALHHNALAVLALPFGGWLLGCELLRRRGATHARPKLKSAWIWGGLAALVLFAVFRNLPAFAFLSP